MIFNQGMQSCSLQSNPSFFSVNTGLCAFRLEKTLLEKMFPFQLSKAF